MSSNTFAPRLCITYERALHGSTSKFDPNGAPIKESAIPKGWFVALIPCVSRTPFEVVFATRDELPLPPSVRGRLAALDMAPELDAHISGLGGVTRYISEAFLGDITYILQITQTEYDQLLAALKGEEK